MASDFAFGDRAVILGRRTRTLRRGVVYHPSPATYIGAPTLGTFHYDASLKVDFDDRVLAHLQIVIGQKLRRRESFYFAWRDDDQIGDGRTTVWLHPALPLVYKYFGSKMPRINPAWIHTLTESANSNGGLQLVPEPAAPGAPAENSTP